MAYGFDLVKIRELAQKKEDENWRFREFMKRECELELEEIDRLVFETTRRVWAGIDCTSCANCCREVKPTFSEEEVDRLARRLGMERGEFIEKYLEPTEAGSENPWQTRAKPCPFLESGRNPGVTRLLLGLGTVGTIAERPLPVRYSGPWSGSAAVGVPLVASSASAAA